MVAIGQISRMVSCEDQENKSSHDVIDICVLGKHIKYIDRKIYHTGDQQKLPSQEWKCLKNSSQDLYRKRTKIPG